MLLILYSIVFRCCLLHDRDVTYPLPLFLSTFLRLFHPLLSISFPPLFPSTHTLFSLHTPSSFSSLSPLYQVEIQTLKQVQAAARQERKMLMMQHKDISKMRRSTQFYRQKIHKYRHHAKTSTPTPEQNQDGHETRPSLDGSRISPGVEEDHLAYSGVLSDIDQRSSMIPSENLDDSFLSYMHLKADLSSSMTEALERTGSSSKSTLSTSNTHLARSSGSTISTSPLKTPSESVTETSLKLSPRDSARSVVQYYHNLS